MAWSTQLVAQQQKQPSSPLSPHRSAKWSPDGSALFTASDDGHLRIYHASSVSTWLTCDREHEPPSTLSPTSSYNAAESVYDACWYPSSTSDSGGHCVLVSARDHPIGLVDAWTGALRCTYPARNDVDEVVAPNALAFSLDGSRFYAGFDGCVRVFDTAAPGACVALHPTTPSRASREGQKGIISAIAVCPDPGAGVYATGSFGGTVGLYTEENSTMLHLADAHRTGVTQLAFSPDGKYLVSGGRRDNELIAWDIRFTGKTLARVPRLCTGNQRMAFGFDAAGNYLVTGQQNGTVLVYDVTSNGFPASGRSPALATAFEAHGCTCTLNK